MKAKIPKIFNAHAVSFDLARFIFLYVCMLALWIAISGCSENVNTTISTPSGSSLYPNGSVFTVDILDNKQLAPRLPATLRAPNDQSIDVAALEFRDDGTYVDQGQLEALLQWISKVRDFNPNGVITVLFIHGWHHSAEWTSPTDGDTHFQSFRLMLASLALRESERYWPGAAGRRVMGIYVGWNGDPARSLIKEIPGVKNLTFWSRYEVAEKIGAGTDLRKAIQAITTQTKEPIANGSAGQIVLAGHSMGGLMLESALLALIEDDDSQILQSFPENLSNPISILMGDDRILFPDAIISLNSAADSQISKRIKLALVKRKVHKIVSGAGVRYSPPLAISVTSTSDKATSEIWSLAKPGRKTVGHDESLFTHTIASGKTTTSCDPRNKAIDRGQNFHCLRFPEPRIGATPTMVIDLPVRDRKGLNDWPAHRRYRIEPIGDINDSNLFWNFQVPSELIDGHNDIFNSRSASMILALVQMSGAVASLAEDWNDSFEE